MARGFSLIELLVVLGVLGVMAALTMPLAEMTVQRERERELKRALWEIRDAIDAYQAARENGALPGAGPMSAYPTSLIALTEPVPDARAGRSGQTLRFLRRVPRDPFADPALPAERTWGLRSFLSDADAPRAGEDVYDVFSTSDRIGLNGVPLRQW